MTTPVEDPANKGWKTHFYGGSSIFGLTPTDEASAMRANKPYPPPAENSMPSQAQTPLRPPVPG